ncbi:MAG TPA: hypothetical protein VNO30_14490 [Kofleriaceae bacterium]|nr:hypothetical protein [Kofleriaceae bacterium]
MNRPTPRFRDGLETLARHGVEFVVVGGVAAVLNGAPISTFDLDIVHARASANLDRLLAALTELDARYRDLTGRVLRPERSALAGDGHHLLVTSCGPLDVLGQIGDRLRYEDLLPETVERTLGTHRFRVLDLAALIRTKEQAGRDKDRAVLAVLRRTLQERGSA